MDDIVNEIIELFLAPTDDVMGSSYDRPGSLTQGTTAMTQAYPLRQSLRQRAAIIPRTAHQEVEEPPNLDSDQLMSRRSRCGLSS